MTSKHTVLLAKTPEPKKPSLKQLAKDDKANSGSAHSNNKSLKTIHAAHVVTYQTHLKPRDEKAPPTIQLVNPPTITGLKSLHAAHAVGAFRSRSKSPMARSPLLARAKDAKEAIAQTEKPKEEENTNKMDSNKIFTVAKMVTKFKSARSDNSNYSTLLENDELDKLLEASKKLDIRNETSLMEVPKKCKKKEQEMEDDSMREYYGGAGITDYFVEEEKTERGRARKKNEDGANKEEEEQEEKDKKKDNGGKRKEEGKGERKKKDETDESKHSTGKNSVSLKLPTPPSLTVTSSTPVRTPSPSPTPQTPAGTALYEEVMKMAGARRFNKGKEYAVAKALKLLNIKPSKFNALTHSPESIAELHVMLDEALCVRMEELAVQNDDVGMSEARQKMLGIRKDDISTTRKRVHEAYQFLMRKYVEENKKTKKKSVSDEDDESKVMIGAF